MVIDLFEEQRKKQRLIDEKTEDKRTVGIVSFNLGEELIGIELQYILEIINLSAITKLYRVPQYLIGITNLRGQIKPVIDLKNFLEIYSESKKNGSDKKGLLVNYKNLDAIVLVDNINKVEWIPTDDLREPPDTTPDNLKEYTTNLVYTKNKPIVVISGEKILNSARWSAFQEE